MLRAAMGVAVVSLALGPAVAGAAGPGPETVGAVEVSTARWHLRTDAGRTVALTYGNPGDAPFAGDWDCDGVDTPGLYRRSDGFVYLRNSNSTGIADVEFFFGDPGDVPLAGDFDGDGCDTVSLYRPSDARVYVINRLGSGTAGLGAAERWFTLGDPGDTPFVADWDGDGVDEVAVRRGDRVFLRSELSAGPVDVSFSFGAIGDGLVAGDWDGDGEATLGVQRGGRFLLRNDPGPGPVDVEFHFGGAGSVPVAGRFGLGDAGIEVDWAPRSLTVAMSGDVLIHTALRTAAARNQPPGRFDFRPMFAPLRPVLEAADLALCHLEVPLTGDDGDLSSFPLFNAPWEVAQGLAAAGYDGCSVASNHSWDRGRRGVVDTLDILDEAGLGHTGTARSVTEDESVMVYDVAGARVAHLSYTWSLNGLRLPAGEGWWANLLDPAAVAVDAARARAEGADLVVVSVHWGDEYVQWPSGYQVTMGRALTADPNVDVVVGHHAHVVQPVGVVNGKYVVYGLGNSASAMTADVRRDGVVAVLDAGWAGSRWRVEGVRFVPTWMERWRVVPALPGYPASYARTAATMQAMGAPGVAPTPVP